MNKKKDKSEICSTRKCKQVALHHYTDEGCKKGSCLVHVPLHQRDIFKAKRYEYTILNSIINKLPDKYTSEIKHNQQVTKEIKSRPDLVLRSKVTNDVVVIEVDEDYHKKQPREDEKREKDLIDHLSDNGSKKVHIIRIIPMEEDEDVRMVKKDSLGIVIKNNNYDDVMDVVNSKIKKRLVGIVSPLSPDSNSRKITPANYKSLKSPEKRTLVAVFADYEEEIVTSFSKFTDALTDPENWKYTYDREIFRKNSNSSSKKSSRSPTSLRESPDKYISRQISPNFTDSKFSLDIFTPALKRVVSLSKRFDKMRITK
jgi:hypothetical protein